MKKVFYKGFILICLIIVFACLFSGCSCKHEDLLTINAKTATCTENGYTGDKICRECGVVIEEGITTMAVGHPSNRCNFCKTNDGNAQAYAIYSESDNSLSFYKNADDVFADDTYNGKSVDRIYLKIEFTEFDESDSYWSDIAAQVKLVEFVDEISPTNTAYWFDSFENCQLFVLKNLNMKNVTNTKAMFRNAAGNVEDVNLDVEHFEMSNVSDASHMFEGFAKNSTEFVLCISDWDVSEIEDASYMFAGVAPNAELCQLNTKWGEFAPTNISHMFEKAGKLSEKFYVCCDDWDMSNVTDMSYMFAESGALAKVWDAGTLSGWDTGNVKNMSHLFFMAGYSTELFTIGDVGKWDVKNVEDMSHLFGTAFTQIQDFSFDLSKWDVSNVKTMEGMFCGAGARAAKWNVNGLENWNVGNVTSMRSMFAHTCCNVNEFVLDLSSWNVGNVEEFTMMFLGTGKRANIWRIGDISKWDVSNAKDMSMMLSGIHPNRAIDVSSWDVPENCGHVDFAAGSKNIIEPDCFLS